MKYFYKIIEMTPPPQKKKKKRKKENEKEKSKKKIKPWLLTLNQIEVLSRFSPSLPQIFFACAPLWSHFFWHASRQIPPASPLPDKKWTVPYYI